MTGTLRRLPVVAAVGLVVVQVSASIFHASRREVSALPVNAVLLVLAAFVAYGRLFIIPG